MQRDFLFHDLYDALDVQHCAICHLSLRNQGSMKTARHPILRTPATLIEALAAACEIIVVLPANQIAVVADFLRRTLRPAIYARAVALCAHPGDVEGFRVVLEAGMPVHAVVTCPEEAIIFVDRLWGWLYPSARTMETPEAQVLRLSGRTAWLLQPAHRNDRR